MTKDSVIRARFNRWWYLLTRGMWRGETAVDYWYTDGSIAMLTTQGSDGVKVWWDIRR